MASRRKRQRGVQEPLSGKRQRVGRRDVHAELYRDFVAHCRGRDRSWLFDSFVSYSKLCDGDKEEWQVEGLVEKSYEGRSIDVEGVDVGLLERMVSACRASGMSEQEAVKAVEKHRSLESTVRLSSDHICIYDCETFSSPSHQPATCYAVGAVVVEAYRLRRAHKVARKRWKSLGRPSGGSQLESVEFGGCCRPLGSRATRTVKGVSLYEGPGCVDRFLRDVWDSKVSECWGYNSANFDHYVLVSNSCFDDGEFVFTRLVSRQTSALKMEFGKGWLPKGSQVYRISGIDRRVGFYDLCEHAAPPKSLKQVQAAFGVPAEYRKGEFEHTVVHDWDSWRRRGSEVGDYLALDVVGTAYLFGKMTCDRQTSFEKMLVTKAKRNEWRSVGDDSMTDSERWRRWLEERGCDSDGYDDDDHDPSCRCRTDLPSLSNQAAPKPCWQFAADTTLTLPAAARNFVYAHADMMTVVYYLNGLMRNLAKALMVGAKTIVYRKWFRLADCLRAVGPVPEVASQVFGNEFPDGWGREERALVAAVDREKVEHLWALELLAGGGSDLEELSHRMLPERRSWVFRCCRSYVKENFDRNSFLEWTWQEKRRAVRTEAAESHPTEWQGRLQVLDVCVAYLRRVERLVGEWYGEDGELLWQGDDGFLELDFNGLYASIMYMAPMPCGDGGVRTTLDEEEARRWLAERNDDRPVLEWLRNDDRCRGNLPVSHYGLYFVDADPPDGCEEMVASVWPRCRLKFKKQKDMEGETVVKTHEESLEWSYRQVRGEWVDSVTLNVATELQGWKLLRVRAAVRWDSVQPSLEHTMKCLYRERAQYKKTNPPEADARKLVMNSCYGKFGESDVFSGVTFDPPSEKQLREKEAAHRRSGGKPYRQTSDLCQETFGTPRLPNPPWVPGDFGKARGMYQKGGRITCVPQQMANAVTSAARGLVHAMWGREALRATRREAEERGEYVCYQDTDNAYLTLAMARKWREKGGVGPHMGQVKNEFGAGVGVFALFPGRKNKLVLYATPNGQGGFRWDHQFKWKGPRQDCVPWTLLDKTCCYQSALCGRNPSVDTYQTSKYQRNLVVGQSNFDDDGYVKNGVRLFVPSPSTVRKHETREGGVWVKN